MELNKIKCQRKNLIENVEVKPGIDYYDQLNDLDLDMNMAKKIANNMFPNDEKRKESFLSLLIDNTKLILNSILNVNNRSILINGEIQSGKTSNLISSIFTLNSIDKYDLIIYFTGRLNELNRQNSERFFNSFKEDVNYIVDSVKDPSDIKGHTINATTDKTLIYSIVKYSDKYDSLYKMIRDNKLKTLIINDEGDDSTLVGLSKKFNEDILQLCNNNKSITITATPFRNLIDYESQYDDYIVLRSPKEYSSIDKFNYINLSNLNKPNEENESHFIARSLDDWMGKIDDKKGNQFLINILNEKDEHKSILSFVKEFIESRIHLNKGKVSDVAKKVSFDQSRLILNGDSGKMTIEDINKREEITIIVGGMKLSRGITFEKLTGQLITSFSDNKIPAGTLLQKARWCGYRDESNTFIYMNDKLIRAFQELVALQEMTLNYKIGNDYKSKFKEMNFKEICK